MANLREVYKLLYFTDFNSYFVLDLLFGLYVFRHTHTHTRMCIDTHTHTHTHTHTASLIAQLVKNPM